MAISPDLLKAKVIGIDNYLKTWADKIQLLANTDIVAAHAEVIKLKCFVDELDDPNWKFVFEISRDPFTVTQRAVGILFSNNPNPRVSKVFEWQVTTD